jgi:hypothetical protein
MQCPSCKEQIDDDSRYCDQCGGQILICSVCGRPGKGKRCIFDGKEMFPAGGAAPQPSAPTGQVNAPAPTQVVSPPPQSPAQAVPPPQYVPKSPAASDKIKLSSQSLGIMIEAADGDTLGRRAGPFAGTFGRFSQVSGAHCKFVKVDGNWHIMDLASTNGTFYNNSRLTMNNPVPLSSNTLIKVADIELLITFDSNDGGTVRI